MPNAKTPATVSDSPHDPHGGQYKGQRVHTRPGAHKEPPIGDNENTRNRGYDANAISATQGMLKNIGASNVGRKADHGQKVGPNPGIAHTGGRSRSAQ